MIARPSTQDVITYLKKIDTSYRTAEISGSAGLERHARFHTILDTLNNESNLETVIVAIYNFYKTEGCKDIRDKQNSRLIQRLEDYLCFLFDIHYTEPSIQYLLHQNDFLMAHYKEVKRQREELEKKVFDFVGEDYKVQILSIKLPENDANAHLSRGVFLEKQNDVVGAMMCYNQALDIQPSCLDAKNNLKMLLITIPPDANISKIKKSVFITAIKKLNEQDQIVLLKSCLDTQTILGTHFWTPKGPTSCSLKQGKLKLVCALLKELESGSATTSLLAKSGQSLFSSSNGIHDEGRNKKAREKKKKAPSPVNGRSANMDYDNDSSEGDF